MENSMKKYPLFVITLFISACAYKPPQTQLEKVAKDWSMTVRASQVMPVYPLEEDIRPGDIYLVANSIERDVGIWNDKGFLPLINRFDRIKIDKSIYDPFFENGFNESGGPSFHRHPMVAFPSYSFNVDQRGVFGIALPLNSVPLALSMSGAQSATGSAVFRGAATQGLPDYYMNKLLKKWANDRRGALMERANNTENQLILRLITKIFTIEGATVSVVFSEVKGVGAQIGSSVSVPNLLGTSLQDYDNLIGQLNRAIDLKKNAGNPISPVLPAGSSSSSTKDPEIQQLEADLDAVNKLKAQESIRMLKRQVERTATEDRFGGYILPGAAVRIASRSARGVAMEESFDKPLVLGYWATEYFVTRNGQLIEIGVVKDLLDNPAEYQRLILLSKTAAMEKPCEGLVDNGNNDNPFKSMVKADCK
jgi:hypothetical protein